MAFVFKSQDLIPSTGVARGLLSGDIGTALFWNRDYGHP